MLRAEERREPPAAESVKDVSRGDEIAGDGGLMHEEADAPPAEPRGAPAREDLESREYLCSGHELRKAEPHGG